MVLAFSAGIKGYIASMQDDMLSGNPIMITETTYDINVITDMINQSMEEDAPKEPLKAYVSSMIEYISKMSEISDSFFIKNELTRDYMNYVKSMPSEYYNAMVFGYGIDFNNSIYTSFTHIDENGNEVVSKISVSALTNIYTSVLKETAYKSYASYITQIAPSFQQAPNNPDYIANQYDVYGEIADEYDEIMIVLNSNQELSDILLAKLGYYTESEFYNLVYKVAHEDEEALKELYNPDLDIDYFDYDELISNEHTFTWYPNNDIYVYNSDTEIKIPGKDTVMNNTPFKYNNDASAINGEGVELRVTGVLIANDTTSYGCLSSGIYYTEALTNHVLEANRTSEIVEYVNEHGAITSMPYGGTNMGIFYSYDYSPIIPEYDENGKRIMHTDTAFIGASLSTSDIIGSMGSMGGGSGAGGSAGGMGGANTSMLASMKTVDARMLGGVDIANEVKIYPLSFDSKDLVTSYLDKWNGEGSITVDGVEFSDADRGNVTYTDALEIIIGMLNTMIDVVSYALIAFTSISLVVSTVMIGIITYVSVVERIKEIGVIRALGGRKKDVSHLFNAETFIIGLLAGIIGVGATYLISIIVNAILRPLIGYASIAALPISQAVLLVCISILLTLISGLIPASGAAKKDPVVALRTE
jgi:putative ABC transport system permease protein